MRQTVTEYLETWITMRAGGHKPRTVERERDLLSHYITPKVGKIAVKRLKPRQIADMLAEICEAGHTRTAEQVFVFLRSAMPDMMAKVPRPQHTPRRREVLSPVDQRRLFPAVMAVLGRWRSCLRGCWGCVGARFVACDGRTLTWPGGWFMSATSASGFGGGTLICRQSPAPACATCLFPAFWCRYLGASPDRRVRDHLERQRP